MAERHPGQAGHDHAAGGNLRVAFLLNAGFTLLEVAGGLFTNSVAILSDALHDAGDSLSLGIAWALQRQSEKKGSAAFTYGYHRLSTLGALITGLVLLIGLVVVVWRAMGRLGEPEPVNAPAMIALSVVGIVVNGAAVLRLRGGESLNEQVVGWHLLEDVLGWVAVLVGSIVMAIWGLPILDPLLSIGIALFVLWNVGKKLRAALGVFLQRAPEGFDLYGFERRVATLPDVRASHDTRAWSLDGERHVLSTHVVVGDGATGEDIAELRRRIRELLAEDNFEHVTIEVEREGECDAAGDAPVVAPSHPRVQ